MGRTAYSARTRAAGRATPDSRAVAPFRAREDARTFRAWLRHLHPDIGQFIAGRLAGYSGAEIAAAREWPHAYLQKIRQGAKDALSRPWGDELDPGVPA